MPSYRLLSFVFLLNLPFLSAQKNQVKSDSSAVLGPSIMMNTSEVTEVEDVLSQLQITEEGIAETMPEENSVVCSTASVSNEPSALLSTQTTESYLEKEIQKNIYIMALANVASLTRQAASEHWGQAQQKMNEDKEWSASKELADVASAEAKDRDDESNRELEEAKEKRIQAAKEVSLVLPGSEAVTAIAEAFQAYQTAALRYVEDNYIAKKAQKEFTKFQRQVALETQKALITQNSVQSEVFKQNLEFLISEELNRRQAFQQADLEALQSHRLMEDAQEKLKRLQEWASASSLQKINIRKNEVFLREKSIAEALKKWSYVPYDIASSEARNKISSLREWHDQKVLSKAEADGAIASSVAAAFIEETLSDPSVKAFWPESLEQEKTRSQKIEEIKISFLKNADQLWSDYIKPSESLEDEGYQNLEAVEKIASDAYRNFLFQEALEAAKTTDAHIAEGAWAARIQMAAQDAEKSGKNMKRLRDAAIQALFLSVTPWVSEAICQNIVNQNRELFTSAAELAMTNIPGVEEDWKKLVEDYDATTRVNFKRWKKENNEEAVFVLQAENRRNAEASYQLAVRDFYRAVNSVDALIAAWREAWPEEFQTLEAGKAKIYYEVISAKRGFKQALMPSLHIKESLKLPFDSKAKSAWKSFEDQAIQALEKYREAYAVFAKAKADLHTAVVSNEIISRAVLEESLREKQSLYNHAQQVVENISGVKLLIQNEYINLYRAQCSLNNAEKYKSQYASRLNTTEKTRTSAAKEIASAEKHLREAEEIAEGKVCSIKKSAYPFLQGLPIEAYPHMSLASTYWEWIIQQQFEATVAFFKAQAAVMKAEEERE